MPRPVSGTMDDGPFFPEVPMTRIQDLDLNLLVVLDALLQELNVTRASRRMGTNQSTLSSALARLRKLLDDPLFVRSQRGLVPTPRALALGPVVRNVLETLDKAISLDDDFQPAKDQRTFILAATDYVQMVVLPPLLAFLRTEAPGIHIEIVPVAHQFPWQELAAGRVDVILGGEEPELAGLQSKLIFRDQVVCVLRPGHPCARGRWDQDTYLDLGHLEVKIMDGLTLVDHRLADMGLQRTVLMSVPHFLLAFFLVAQGTDLCFTVAERIVNQLSPYFPVTVLPLPFGVPSVAVRASWHERMKSDSAHRWLRNAIFQAAEAAGTRALPSPVPAVKPQPRARRSSSAKAKA